MFLAKGDIVAGRYRIKSKVARGGMGMIYEAVQETLERRVALKMILPTMVDNPISATRFRREIEIAQALAHRNIIEIYDFGEEDGVYWVAMEFLDGLDLSNYLMKHGPLPYSKAVDFTRQTLEALAMAHKRGVVHRDIKASNVFIEELASGEEVVKLLDFGVAKSMDDQSKLTGTGNICGSTAYMAPEMLLYGDISLSVDVYALGLLMTEMLVAKRVVSGSAIGMHVQQQSRGQIILPEPFAGSSLESFIKEACAKQPADRFPTAREMLGALNALRSEIAPDARIALRDADGFKLAITEEGSYERKKQVVVATPEPEAIRIAADPEDVDEPGPMRSSSGLDPAVAVTAAGSYDPGVYFDKQTEQSRAEPAESAPNLPQPSPLPPQTNTDSDLSEAAQPAPAEASRSKNLALAAILVGTSLLAALAFAIVQLDSPSWKSPESVIAFVERDGWSCSASTIIESNDRRIQTLMAFKGSSSMKLEFRRCRPLSDCKPNKGVVIAAEGFWIKLRPGAGKSSKAYESMGTRLSEGPPE